MYVIEYSKKDVLIFAIISDSLIQKFKTASSRLQILGVLHETSNIVHVIRLNQIDITLSTQLTGIPALLHTNFCLCMRLPACLVRCSRNILTVH